MANQRKAGKKKVGVWLTNEEREAMTKAAKAAGYKNLADWLRSLITKGTGLLIAVLIGFHYVRSPKVWTVAALKQTVKVAWVKAKTLLPK